MMHYLNHARAWLAGLMFLAGQNAAWADSTSTLVSVGGTITNIVHAGDGSNRLFITTQGGVAHVVDLDDATPSPATFFDLSGLSHFRDGSERGLLGLAFDPDFANNRYFYIYYSAAASYDPPGATCGVPSASFSINHQSVISRVQVQAGNPNAADLSTEVCLLNFAQPYGNHNGGQLAFGPDNKLYIASGDGGSGGDPDNNGQNNNTLLGKLLRLDPGLPAPHIPSDNPFVGQANTRAEIWATGLRNPWRFSFDRQTGDLWISDVGQNAWEEVNLQPASSTGGENYGWDCYEASANYASNPNYCLSNPVFPILEYERNNGRCAITGGYAYRGPGLPAFQGKYFFIDLCSDEVWMAQQDNNGNWQMQPRTSGPGYSTTWGEDEAGNLYIGNGGGTVYRYHIEPLFSDGFESP